ncbi:MAG: C25 family cysteine peptidase [Saprospiraceae bacterium]
MKRIFIYSFVVLSFLMHHVSDAQIVQGKDTLYGNEWIRYNQTYYKFYISKDGLYQLTYNELLAAGIPLNTIKGAQLQVWRNGIEIPLLVNNSGIWNTNDLLQFWGTKNRSELDALLFSDPDKEMLNPEYSLVSDSSTYFITWVQDGVLTKRISLIASNNQLPVSPFYIVDQLLELHAYPIDKKYDFSNEINLSSFDECEGFGTAFSQQYTQTLKAQNPYLSTQEGSLIIRLAAGNANHILKISINNVVVTLDSFYGYALKEYKLPITNSLLANDIVLKIEGTSPGNELFSVSNIHFIYPKISGAAIGPLENILSSNTPLLSSPGNIAEQTLLISSSSTIWYTPVVVNNQSLLELPQASNRSLLYVADKNKSTGSLKLINAVFTTISDNKNTDYLIITHSRLAAAAEEYASYRRSGDGGSFNVRVIDIEQIYDQFGYGMTRHVLGLRNYGQYIYRSWPSLKYVFMIGRSVNYRDLRVDNNINLYGNLHLIPTFGYPGSDNLIFSKINSSIPVFNSARLAATTPEQVRSYLTKVKEYELKLKKPTSNDDLYWRKRILHLAGGDPVVDGFDRILDGFQSVLEPTDYKADFISVKKTSSDPIQGGVSEIVKNAVNQGVALNTYLGHGAISATEIGLDDPELFNNSGKYPFGFTLGCNSGNMHTPGVSLSESFVFSKKGDIAYIASTGIGTDAGYREYGNILYGLLGRSYYDKSISQLHYKTLQAFDNSKDYFTLSLNQQLTLHGDPALQFNYYNEPDFTLDSKSFKTIPQNVLADQDSIRFDVTLWNLGRHTSDPLEYKVTHQLPDGSVKEYNFIEHFTAASKEIHVHIPMPPNAVGNNILNIKLDPENKFNELPTAFAENNNELRQNNNAGIVVSIINTEARPVYPKDFGIVGESNVDLQAATSDAFGNLTNFYFEIDSTALFNSPLLKKGIVNQRGGLIHWKPAINQTAGKVYYWRVATDTAVTHTLFIWNQSSFVYLPNQGPGWNQSHSYQYASNSTNQTVSFDLPSNQWKLSTRPASFVASSINSQLDPAEYSKVLIDGARYTRNNGTYQSEFIITLWDPKIGLIRNPVGGRDGAANVFSVPAPGYYFGMDKNTTEERKNLMRFMEEGIQDGQYVIVINHIDPGATYYPEFWAQDSVTLGKNLFQVFEANGAKKIRNLLGANYSFPYVFVYQKGKKVLDEAISITGLEVRSVFELPTVQTTGDHESSLIGPASSWEKLEWATDDKRPKNLDNVIVYGKNGDNYDSLYSVQASSLNLKDIDATKYPYLKLKWSIKDEARTQSLNLVYWRIFYKSFSDLAIAANDDFEFYKDTIDQGENVRLRFTVQNIGDRLVDSSMVVYTIIDEQNRTRMDTITISSIAPGGKKVLSKEISTESRIKNQSLLVNLYSLSSEPETSIRNNAGKLNYFVVADIIPPTITVLFDGKQILNNEIVPRQPRIHIDLKDNKVLSTMDTSQIVLSIKFPNTEKYKVIPVKDYVITYNQAQASIEYNPKYTVDGLYTLRIQGKDRSGNIAGTANANDYEINFKIFTENSVSTILPYPNPFSTQCKFAYTLTGDIPMVFKIQIMTVSGRVVRELTELDLGPLQEGTHLTERSWDGNDEYGNKLATGTYLYRVVMKDNSGKSYSSYETLEDKSAETSQDARKFFTKGIGKLVILR